MSESVKIYAGVSGFAYATWRGGFYPEKLAPAKFLGYYGSKLNAVEINYTFRQIPSEKTIANWSGAVPSSFRFCCKAPMRVTHILKLRNCREPLDRLKASVQGLALGPTLVQLPEKFKSEPQVLREFLEEAPPDFPMAFEFRHESWFQDEVFSLLEQHKAALCLAESDELVTPEVVTAPFVYRRLRRSSYSEQDIERIAAGAVAAASAGRTSYLFFMHEDEPFGPNRAVAVLQRVNGSR